MCGIIGIVGSDKTQRHLLAGLARLEYRGYDSAGIATISDDAITCRKAIGKLKNLIEEVGDHPLHGTIGVGHTRWATHGAVNVANAHPHCVNDTVIVHNGIIDNHEALQKQFDSGALNSDTDSEIIAHLLDAAFARNPRDPKRAMMEVLAQLEGAFAFVAMSRRYPDTLFAARLVSPLALGHGREGDSPVGVVGSDAMALAGLVADVTYLEDGDFAIITADDARHFTRDGAEAQRRRIHNPIDPIFISKNNYRHFMEKEIHEQPEAIAHTYSKMMDAGAGILKPGMLDELINQPPPAISILAAGTSYYAGLIGRYWLESIAGIPTTVEIAAEYHYRRPVRTPGALAIAISQSGESIDTLLAQRHAAAGGLSTLALVNNAGSSIDREADHTLYTYAGMEVGVASTKAFTAQLVALLVLALALAVRRDEATEDIERIKAVIPHLPGALSKALLQEEEIRAVAHRLVHDTNRLHGCLYLGRGLLYPLALEGALKLKEVGYIYAEGFAAGEMKHGPIALIEEGLPTIALLTHNSEIQKTVGNLREAANRGARIILITDESAGHLVDFAADQLILPYLDATVAPIILAIPIQLLAYYTAIEKGTDVDQPRNLAKSVTVE